MLLKVAWRNIWRNKMRSLVLMASVAVGLFAGLFIMAFSWGLYKEHIHDVIATQLSHIQIHHPLFGEDRLVKYTLTNTASLDDYFKKNAQVRAVSHRITATGMISSPTFASGVQIYGITPGEEKKVSSLAGYITEGNYLNSEKSADVVIGENLAKKLKVKLKSKLVLTFQSKSGDITSGSFRIKGLFRTKNSAFDEGIVYVNSKTLADLLGTGDEVHEIAVLLNEDAQTDAVAKELRSRYPTLEILTWKDLAPEFELLIDAYDQYMYIFIGIILLALMFGVVNTMLMAVLERQREFGVLMAIGMSKPRVFTMIVMETVFVICIGLPVGLLLSYITVGYFNRTGIDVSRFSEGLAQYGFPTIIRPEQQSNYYLPVTLMTAGSAVISAIYPAIRALRLKPGEAIRKI